MAYLILSMRGDELDRRELVEPTVIGRAPDCDVAVHDILLSRKHCLLEQSGDGWAIIDLDSKNGTFVNGSKVDVQALRDGDVVEIGKLEVSYHSGTLIPRPDGARRPAAPPTVAVDPQDALAGTMLGVDYHEPA